MVKKLGVKILTKRQVIITGLFIFFTNHQRETTDVRTALITTPAPVVAVESVRIEITEIKPIAISVERRN